MRNGVSIKNFEYSFVIEFIYLFVYCLDMKICSYSCLVLFGACHWILGSHLYNFDSSVDEINSLLNSFGVFFLNLHYLAS